MSTWTQRINWVESRPVDDAVCGWILFRLAQRLDDDDADVYGDRARHRQGRNRHMTVAKLAAFCQATENTVRRHLRHLERSGLVLSERQRCGPGSAHPGIADDTVYLLNMRGLTPEQWHDERTGTRSMPLLIEGRQPHAKTASGAVKSTDPQVSDQTQKLRVASDLGKRESQPHAKTASGAVKSTDPQVSDQTQKLRVASDLGKRESQPHAKTASGDLLPPLGPSSHPQNGWTDGREIDANDEPEDEPDDGVRLIDDLPWKVLPMAGQAAELAGLARAALAHGWTVDDLYRQLSANMWNAANSDGVMVDRLRHLPRPKPVRKPRPPQRGTATVAAASRRAAAAQCDACDEEGYRGSVLCDHEPDRIAINARGLDAAREALAKRTNRPA